MGIVGYAIAAGIGYYAGQPEGRRQLMTLRRQAAELARSPEVRRLRERGWDLVGDGALATRNFAAKARSKANPTGGAPDVEAAATTRSGPSRVLRGRRWRHRPRPDSAATVDPAPGTADPAGLDRPAGFSGTTVAEDSEAAILGISPPPLAARNQPTAPPKDRS
jgi:hypothetical protein